MTNFARRNFGVELGRHFGGLFLIRVVLVVVAEVRTRYLGVVIKTLLLCFSAGKFLVFFFVCFWCDSGARCWRKYAAGAGVGGGVLLHRKQPYLPPSLHIIRVHMQYYPTHTTLYCIVHFIPNSSYPHFFELQTIM